MAGILGNDSSLTSKAAQLAQSVVGETPQGAPEAGEIILHDFHLRGIPSRVGMVAVLKELQSGLKMYREKNTIMAIKKLSPQAAQIHFFTIDPEPVFDSLVSAWVNKFRQAGGKVIYDTVADPHIIRALQKAGVHLQQPDNPQYKIEALV